MGIENIAQLMDAGGPFMWSISIDCLVLWALLAERILTLCGPRTQEREEIVALSKGAVSGLHKEDAVAKTECLAMAEELVLTRHFALIRCLIAVAPLLGLLGTVSGMIMTFGGILVGRRMEAASIGIAEALLTTQFSLAVVVPALIAERMLTRRSRRIAERRSLESANILRDLPLDDVRPDGSKECAA